MKKWIAILTTLALTACFFYMPLVSATEQDVKWDEASGILAQLSIDSGINKEPQEMISRGEFAALVVRSLHVGAAYGENDAFADCVNHPFQSEIYTARALGITSGTSAATFSPEEGVLTEVAAKMTVAALGHAQLAEYKGGYPSGYMMLAERLGIFKGVQKQETLTVRDAYVMIYNMLTAEVAVVTSVKGDEIETEQIKGACLLTENFDFDCIEGVITAAGYDTIDTFAGQNKIKVGGQVFIYQHAMTGLLGYDCRVWYRDDEAYAISKTNRNEEVVIEAENIESFSGQKLKTMNQDGKTNSYTLEKGFTFVKNGRVIEHTAASFLFENGFVKLIDNDRDGSYDVVICESYEYFVISAIDTRKRVLYDYHSALESITLSEDGESCCEVWINGERSDFSALDIDMVCRVYLSDDEKVCRIWAGDQTVSGQVSLIDEDQLTVGETVYERSRYTDRLDTKINAGTSYTFLLSDEGVIVGISGTGNGQMRYGYLLGYDNSGRGLSNAQLKILTDSGSREVFELANKVTLDGVAMNCKDLRIAAELTDGSAPKYQVIRYKARRNEITHLDTAVERLGEMYIGAAVDTEDSLTKSVWQTKINYRSSVGFGIPNVSFSGAVIFAVPKAMLSEPTALYDDSLFTVISSSELYNNRDYTVDAYDYNQQNVPQAITVYSNVNETETVVPAAETTVYMVEKVRDAVADNGDAVKELVVYNNTKYTRVMMKLTTFETLQKNGKMPTPGDVVRFAFDREGFVSGVALDVDYTLGDDSVTINYSDGVSTSGKEYLTYFAGKVLKKSDNFMTLRTEAAPSDAVIDHQAVLCLRSPKCIMFSKRKGTVKAVDISNIVSEDAGGSSAASHVVCRTNYYSVNTIYIYAE